MTRPSARPVFRRLAGLCSPFFLLAAIAVGFPQWLGLNLPPSPPLAALLAAGGMTFATIAATGLLTRP